MFGRRVRSSIASVRALFARRPELPYELRPIAHGDATLLHASAVRSLALVANGTLGVSVDWTRPSLCVWNAVDGRCLRRIEGATGGDGLAAMLPTADGRLCVTVDDARPWALRVWDLTTGACRETVSTRSYERFVHLALDPANERAVAVSYQQPLMDPDCKVVRLTVVDLRAAGRARTFDATDEAYAVGSIVVHPDGRRVLIGLDGIVEVWDLDTEARVARLDGGGWSPHLALDAAGARCFAGTREGRVITWDVATSTRTRELDVGARYASVNLLPDEQRCVTLGLSGPARVWDLETGAKVHDVGTKPSARADVVFDRTGALMLEKRGDDVLEVWDVTTGALLASVRVEEPLPSFAITRDTNGRARVAVGQGKRVRFFELVPNAGRPS